MKEIELCFMVGVLRKVAKLAITEERITVEASLLLVAQEIEDGLKAFNEGDRKPVTANMLLDGVFIGDKK